MAIRYSQVRSELRCSKPRSPFHAATRVSCTASSASCAFSDAVAVHLELALVGLETTKPKACSSPARARDDQIRSHDRILTSLLSPGTCVPLTGTDTVRTANRALRHRPCFPARRGQPHRERGPGPGARQ